MKKILQIIIAVSLCISSINTSTAQSEKNSFSIGGKNNTEILASAVLPNGNILAGGKSGIWSVLGEYSPVTGKPLWEWEIQSEKEVVCKDFIVDENGIIYVLLYFKKDITFAGNEIKRTDMFYHSIIAKISPGGKVGPDDFILLENLRAEKLIYHTDAGLVAGFIFNNKINFMGKQSFEGSMEEILLTGFSKDLKNQWVQAYTGNNNNNITAMTTDATGNIYMAGTAIGNISFTGEKIDVVNLNENTKACAFITKIDKNGKALWARMIPGTGNTIINALAANNTGILYAGGYFAKKWNYGGVSAVGSNNGDAFLTAFSNDGQKIDWFLQGKTEMQSAINTIQLNGNDIYAGGFYMKTLSFGNQNLKTSEDPAGFKFMSNGFMLKADKKGNAQQLTRFEGVGGASVTSVSAGKNLLIASGNYYTGLKTTKLNLKASTSFASGFATIYETKPSTDVPTNNSITTGKDYSDFTFYVEAKDHSYLLFYIFDYRGYLKYCGVVNEKEKLIIPMTDKSIPPLPAITEGTAKKKITPALPKPTGPIINDNIFTPLPPAPKCGTDKFTLQIEKIAKDGSATTSVVCLDKPKEETDNKPPKVENNKTTPEPEVVINACQQLPPYDKIVCICEKYKSKITELKAELKTVSKEMTSSLSKEIEKNPSKSDELSKQMLAQYADLEQQNKKNIKNLEDAAVNLVNEIIANNTITIPVKASGLKPGMNITGGVVKKMEIFCQLEVVFKISGFPKDDYNSTMDTYRTPSALNMDCLDKSDNKIISAWSLKTGPVQQCLGEAKTQFDVVKFKALKSFTVSLHSLSDGLDIEKAKGWKCAPETPVAKSFSFPTPNTSDKHLQFYKDWLAGSIEVSAEGMSILAKLYLAMTAKKTKDIAVSGSQLFVWSFANLADFHYELMGNRNNILDKIKDNKDAFFLVTDVVDAASGIGTLLKSIEKTSNPEFIKSMTDVLQLIDETYKYQTEHK